MQFFLDSGGRLKENAPGPSRSRSPAASGTPIAHPANELWRGTRARSRPIERLGGGKSAPGLIRTGDTRFRKPLLFHTELLGRRGYRLDYGRSIGGENGVFPSYRRVHVI